LRKEAKKGKFIQTDLLAPKLFSKNSIDDLVSCTHSDHLKEKFLNSKFNRFKHMGRVGRFYKYKNFVKYGYEVKERRLVDLRKVNLKHLIVKERNKPYSYESDLPLPINKISKIVGVYNGKVYKKGYKPTYDMDLDAYLIIGSVVPE